MGFFTSPRTRDWTAPRSPIDHRVAFAQNGQTYQQQPRFRTPTEAANVRELSDLSQRMHALQAGMAGLRDELQASRRASMSDVPPRAAFAQARGPAASFQPNQNVLNAAMAAQQAAFSHGTPGPSITMPGSSLNDVSMDGLESMLQDGRSARARAATWPTSPGPYQRPAVSMRADSVRMSTPPQPIPVDTPPFPRNSSPLDAFTFGRSRVPSVSPAMMAETPPLEMPVPGQAYDIPMVPGLSRASSPASTASMDMPGASYFPSSGLAPDPLGIPRTGSPYQASQMSQDLFGGSSYQFPNPFDRGQRGQFGHPAYQAGFNTGGRLPPGFGGMATGGQQGPGLGMERAGMGMHGVAMGGQPIGVHPFPGMHGMMGSQHCQPFPDQGAAFGW